MFSESFLLGQGREFPASDTVLLDLKVAEKTFSDSNLQILAQKYNVSAAKALIIQAKLYPNPNVSLSQGAFNTETGGWFQTDKTHGEEALQLSQIIVLSHKIKKQVNIAETNYKLVEDNLYDLLRTLKFGLRTTFYNIYYLQQSTKVYDEEISSLKTIVNAYKAVQGKGYVADADVVRVQAQLYALQSEYQALNDNINDLESELRLLLQAKPNVYFIPTVNPDLINADPLHYSLKALVDSAYKNRTDLMIAKDNVVLSNQNYTLQKALAVPDVSLGIGYDRNGSYINNFNAINVGMDIPVFNRNQGNIKNAKYLLDYSQTNLTLTQKTLEEQIYRSVQKAADADKLYRNIDPEFAAAFNRIAREMASNYMKRNISLLNFLNFYDSYKQNVVQFNAVLFGKINALENINFLTGTNFFNK
jgi:outer membrane protein, heavy metal efflux system